MTELSYAIGYFIAWLAHWLDSVLIKHSRTYCNRRYWEDWERFRIASDHVWNKNLMEVLRISYGYDKDFPKATEPS